MPFRNLSESHQLPLARCHISDSGMPRNLRLDALFRHRDASPLCLCNGKDTAVHRFTHIWGISEIIHELANSAAGKRLR